MTDFTSRNSSPTKALSSGMFSFLLKHMDSLIDYKYFVFSYSHVASYRIVQMIHCFRLSVLVENLLDGYLDIELAVFHCFEGPVGGGDSFGIHDTSCYYWKDFTRQSICPSIQ
jgi:hypothetical protein